MAEDAWEGPVVSVIIPAFDVEDTLATQLEAFSRQDATFAWELLVCDNGSTDRTTAVVSRWLDLLPPLVLVDASERRGPSAARNVGASVARADLLLFCDADDVVADDWLVTMCSALTVSAVVGGAGESDRLNPAGQRSVSWSQDTVITMPYWPRFPAAASNNLGVRASVFAQVGGFDESMRAGEDVDLCWRAQLAGASFSRCDEAVVHVRKRVGLVPVFRQAYSYAVGELQLRHKYAPLIADYWRDAAARESAVTQTSAVPSRGRGLARRLKRLARADGLADAAWRAGQWLGKRVGTIDTSAQQITTAPR